MDDDALLVLTETEGAVDEGRLTVDVARAVAVVVAFTIETLASPSFDEVEEEVVELEGVDDWAIADEVSCVPADGAPADSLTLATDAVSLTVVTVVTADAVVVVVVVDGLLDTGVVTLASVATDVECGLLEDNFVDAGVTLDVISVILGIPFFMDPFSPEPGKLIMLDDVTVNGVAVAPKPVDELLLMLLLLLLEIPLTHESHEVT